MDRLDRWVEMARDADGLVTKPATMVLIVVVALIANRIVQRAIRRFVAGLESGSVRRGISGSGLGGANLVATGPPSVRAHQRAGTIGLVLHGFTRFVIFILTVLLVLSEFGVNLAPLIAGAGIAGVALGFGAQALVRDFLSGLFMLIEDQLGVGDIVDAGEATGQVEGISLRTTRLRDEAGTIWHIPNGEIRRVGNKSQGGGNRVAPDSGPSPD